MFIKCKYICWIVKIKMRTYAAALTPLPPCTQCVRIGLDPLPHPCVRTSWMTPYYANVQVCIHLVGHAALSGTALVVLAVVCIRNIDDTSVKAPQSDESRKTTKVSLQVCMGEKRRGQYKASNNIRALLQCKAQLSNEMGVGFLTIAKSVSYECNFFRIYDYI